MMFQEKYFSCYIWSSLENYKVTTRHNTRQHEYNSTQHETTQVQHETTRVQRETTRDNMNTKQHNIYFDLFITSLYTRSLVSKPLFILKILFSSNSQNRTRKSQGSGLLQLCSCLSISWNNFNSIFRFETSYKKAFEWM